MKGSGAASSSEAGLINRYRIDELYGQAPAAKDKMPPKVRSRNPSRFLRRKVAASRKKQYLGSKRGNHDTAKGRHGTSR